MASHSPGWYSASTSRVMSSAARRIFALGDPPPARAARRILHAGEPCPEPLKRRAMEWLPGTLWEFYGSTEGQFTAISPDEWLGRPGSVGRARRARRLEVADPSPDGVGTVYVTALLPMCPLPERTTSLEPFWVKVSTVSETISKPFP